MSEDDEDVAYARNTESGCNQINKLYHLFAARSW